MYRRPSRRYYPNGGRSRAITTRCPFRTFSNRQGDSSGLGRWMLRDVDEQCGRGGGEDDKGQEGIGCGKFLKGLEAGELSWTLASCARVTLIHGA
jgi:hypothetical protein